MAEQMLIKYFCIPTGITHESIVQEAKMFWSTTVSLQGNQVRWSIFHSSGVDREIPNDPLSISITFTNRFLARKEGSGLQT